MSMNNKLLDMISIESDVCREILGDSIAEVLLVARIEGKSPFDVTFSLKELYRNLEHERKRTRFYDSEEDIINCNKLIDKAREILSNASR